MVGRWTKGVLYMLPGWSRVELALARGKRTVGRRGNDDGLREEGDFGLRDGEDDELPEEEDDELPEEGMLSENFE